MLFITSCVPLVSKQLPTRNRTVSWFLYPLSKRSRLISVHQLPRPSKQQCKESGWTELSVSEGLNLVYVHYNDWVCDSKHKSIIQYVFQAKAKISGMKGLWRFLYFIRIAFSMTCLLIFCRPSICITKLWSYFFDLLVARTMLTPWYNRPIQTHELGSRDLTASSQQWA